MTTAAPTESDHPVVTAIADLIAAYERALSAFRAHGLEEEASALLPDRDLLVVLHSRLGFLRDEGAAG